MYYNDKIVESAYLAMKGEISVPRLRSGYCLRMVRQILEHALGWEDEELYKRFPEKIDTIADVGKRAFWSRDIQRSLREAGWGIPIEEVLPGDIVAYWKAAKTRDGEYVGHIGIVLPGGFVLENVHPAYRAGVISFASGALALTQLEGWGTEEVEAFRVPEDL